MLQPSDYLKPGIPGLCWRRSDNRVFERAPKRISELIALHVVSGRMRYMVDDQILTLGKSALLWVHSDQAGILLSETSDFDMWVLVISPKLFDPLHLFPPLESTTLPQSPEGRLLNSEKSTDLYRIAAALREEDDADCRAIGIKWWTVRAWEAWRTSEIMAGARAHPAVHKAADLLRHDPTLSLTEVARLAGLSPSHLSRLFKSETGMPLADFRNERRLDLVDVALAANQAPPLLTAALDAGFGSYPQFFRAFRKARGARPRDYYRL